MIIFFHLSFLISKYLLTILYKRLNKNRSLPDSESHCSEIDENSIFSYQENIGAGSRYVNGQLKFYPPVYVQRYETVSFILRQQPWKESLKKVIEFGCAELGFFFYLKEIPGLEEILEVDIDENILNRYVFKAMPLNSDYLLCERPKPLNVFILCGSIADYDDCLSGTDAVVAIELIEHLEPEVLDKVPWNIFHKIKPKIAIFTTPNADFNVLFPNLVGFRHPDHKFEWTRKEFYKWTLQITKTYPTYSVKLYGIGNGPEGSQNVGCCTQMAVFTRNDDFEVDNPILESKEFNKYKLIEKFIYPFYVDERTDEEKILDEVMYRVKFTICVDVYYNQEKEYMEIPLSHLMYYVSEWCKSEEDLRKILVDHGFYVTEKNKSFFLIYDEIPNSFSENIEEYSVDFDCPEENSQVELKLENWDEECDDENLNDVPDKSVQEGLENSKMRLETELDFGDGKTDYKLDEFQEKITSLQQLNIASLNKLPKRKIQWNFLKNQSRNLIRFSSLPEDLEISFQENDLQNDLKRSSSESNFSNVMKLSKITKSY